MHIPPPPRLCSVPLLNTTLPPLPCPALLTPPPPPNKHTHTHTHNTPLHTPQTYADYNAMVAADPEYKESGKVRQLADSCRCLPSPSPHVCVAALPEAM